MTKPISDKAEIALEYPDKLYVGTFERSSRFEAHLYPAGSKNPSGQLQDFSCKFPTRWNRELF
jgi:hypothetical protein